MRWSRRRGRPRAPPERPLAPPKRRRRVDGVGGGPAAARDRSSTFIRPDPTEGPSRDRTTSKRPQKSTRNHPRPSFLETSRVDGVGPPQHRGAASYDASSRPIPTSWASSRGRGGSSTRRRRNKIQQPRLSTHVASMAPCPAPHQRLFRRRSRPRTRGLRSRRARRVAVARRRRPQVPHALFRASAAKQSCRY